MKRKIPAIRIQTQFFITFFCISVLYAILLSSIFYSYTSKKLLEHETSSFQISATHFQNTVDTQMQNLDSESMNIGYNDYTKDYLFRFFNESTKGPVSTNNINKLFNAFNLSTSAACQMTLYDLEGNTTSAGTFSRTFQVTLDDLDWVADLNESGSSKLVSKPFSTDLYSSSDGKYKDYISIYRPLFNTYGSMSGYIELTQTCKSIFLDLIAEKKKNPDIGLYVFAEDGTLIYPYEEISEDERSIAKSYFDSCSLDAPITLKNHLDGDFDIVAAAASSCTDWTYICAEPRSTILASLQDFNMLLAVVFSIMLLFALGMAYLSARLLTKPIQHLAAKISRTHLDTLAQVPEHKNRVTILELKELDQAFTQKSVELQDSMNKLLETRQQEVKSRSLALQSQINPHFYSNCLSSIGILAEIGDTDSIGTMTKNLGDLMHYLSNSDSLTVTVAQEAEYIRKYLYCMKIRYQSSFSYDVDLPAAILNAEVPRLIIQPIVENSLKYGFDCNPPWELHITGETADDHWMIKVYDHGPGFSSEALEKIKSRILDADSNIGMPKMEINGMGFLNVYLRWKLFCGKDYLFNYGNLPEGGAFVAFGRKNCYTKTIND